MIMALLAAAAALGIWAGMSPAQPGYRGLPSSNGPRAGRPDIPDWTVDDQFKHDVFTFARVRYDSWRRGGKWATDYPDSDLNFSFRLQQLTSLKVHPDGAIVELTDPRLFDYPFICMCEPGDIILPAAQVGALPPMFIYLDFALLTEGGRRAPIALVADQLESDFKIPKRILRERLPTLGKNLEPTACEFKGLEGEL